MARQQTCKLSSFSGVIYTMSRWLWKFTYLTQRIIDMNRNGNSAFFFSYVCNGKKIKELFASTLDRIPISVSCVSSMITVSNDKFALLLAAHADKDTIGTEEARLQNHVLLAETHWRLTFIAVLTAHAKTSLLYIFQQSMQTNSNTNL